MMGWKLLYGDVHYRSSGQPDHYLLLYHAHNEGRSNIGFLLELHKKYTTCDKCRQKFPSRSKLETMVGLKELTE